ncbi:MAG TPA: bifunctional demethylmenaquinone methyltransferase/2-methoxy-6-polyprenyl-1,4-benzoquinol methylase UbiE [Edaphocola sp.]|nr:bifunctional demethylmenaquinone methyltransferase/2-methoxy-6-polyprenyl-1,4-benzoquinol methylase UbiE [Edaphocola sp.]
MEKTSKTVTPLPESQAGKKQQVAEMFDRISERYDLLNHLLSLNIDKKWRKKAIQSLTPIQPKVILDVATGTGDLAITALNLNPESIIGVDISKGMLEKGKIKIKEKGLDQKIELQYGDSEQLPFEASFFDAVTCAYGVRNFANLEKGLSEMSRVLRPGGRLAILEFSKPKNFLVKPLFKFYFKFILPTIGKLISKDNGAYTYLPESVEAFPEGKEFVKILNRNGFSLAKANPLSFGITTLYTAEKK